MVGANQYPTNDYDFVSNELRYKASVFPYCVVAFATCNDLSTKQHLARELVINTNTFVLIGLR